MVDSKAENTDSENNSIPSALPGAGSNDIENMYESWFLDYASYVILDRAVPNIYDGLKPVQRRILHAMFELEDGRYNKAANIIGHTMRYHPHGDMAIEDAMVKMAQKDLLIDTQGNWGNPATGDRAAAPRYIEARLTPFAKEVVFKEEVTEWQPSYDGRNNEPLTLPVKFPLLLLTGVEGIAVGLSTKVMPHNFNEVIDQSIRYLQGKSIELYPDFPSGGIIDVRDYKGGQRGGRLKHRASMEALDSKTIRITEIPYGVTTASLIESIISANDKGKIRIKKVEDNTAQDVEILVYLSPGVSPHTGIDGLYAFTDCEVNISPCCCVIQDMKPSFCEISDLLSVSVDHTVELLTKEYQIKQDDLLNKLHLGTLEILFIEEKIYQSIEICESWEDVLSAIKQGLKPFTERFIKDLSDDDVTKLTEIKIKRISKFDRSKAEDTLNKIKEQLEDIQDKLKDMTKTTIAYFRLLKKNYGKDRERRSEISTFDAIKARDVAVPNCKLYINRREGFIGTSLKKDELLLECSNLDEVLAVTRNGQMMVSKVSEKTFFGKNIIYAGLFNRGDSSIAYHVIYRDGLNGPSYKKRFAMQSLTRDKQFELGRGTKGTRLLHFSVNPDSAGEIVEVTLKPESKSRNKIIDVNFSELNIQTRSVKGTLVTKEPVGSVEVFHREASQSISREIWYHEETGRLNVDNKGKSLGQFEADDQMFVIYKNGSMELFSVDLDTFFSGEVLYIGRVEEDLVVSCVYYHGEKQDYYVKRFNVADMATGKCESFMPPVSGTKLLILSMNPDPVVKVSFKKGKRSTPEPELVDLVDVASVKSVKALGNKLSRGQVKGVKLVRRS